MFSRRHLQRRLALAVLGSTVTAAALTACDSSAVGGSKTRQPAKVVFWNYGGGGVSDQLFAATVDAYKKASPETTVERVGIPSAEIQDKLVVSWTSDVVPDIVMDSNRGFLRFMDSNWFLDLSKEFAS